jgi:FMN phosphatase YigB (HAD superfamily)
MLVGLDFDNTIVRYDRLFHRLAVERGLIPPGVPVTKQAVRDYLRAADREADWTELQGIAYGPRITDAEPFPSVKSFLARCTSAGVRVAVVSHKTRRPYRGAEHDLHAAAHAFLAAHGFYETSDTGLSPDHVFLELTLAAKLGRVGSLGCAAFVDDLPEVLAEPAFPAGVRKVLFDPAGTHSDDPAYTRVTSWAGCEDAILARREVFA